MSNEQQKKYEGIPLSIIHDADLYDIRASDGFVNDLWENVGMPGDLQAYWHYDSVLAKRCMSKYGIHRVEMVFHLMNRPFGNNDRTITKAVRSIFHAMRSDSSCRRAVENTDKRDPHVGIKRAKPQEWHVVHCPERTRQKLPCEMCGRIVFSYADDVITMRPEDHVTMLAPFIPVIGDRWCERVPQEAFDFPDVQFSDGEIIYKDKIVESTSAGVAIDSRLTKPTRSEDVPQEIIKATRLREVVEYLISRGITDETQIRSTCEYWRGYNSILRRGDLTCGIKQVMWNLEADGKIPVSTAPPAPTPATPAPLPTPPAAVAAPLPASPATIRAIVLTLRVFICHAQDIAKNSPRSYTELQMYGADLAKYTPDDLERIAEHVIKESIDISSLRALSVMESPTPKIVLEACAVVFNILCLFTPTPQAVAPVPAIVPVKEAIAETVKSADGVKAECVVVRTHEGYRQIEYAHEIDEIRVMADTMSDAEIAEKTGYSLWAIQTARTEQYIGTKEPLRFRNKLPKLAGQVDYIRIMLLRREMTDKQLAKKLHVHISSIRSAALGLTHQNGNVPPLTLKQWNEL